MDLTLWHNPRCSKSREALRRLQAAGRDPGLRLYLKAPPSEAELRALLGQLDLAASELIRRGEPLFRELDLARAREAEILAAMVAHPILIERPILVAGARAVVGRPPERVLELF